jgi:hypothetical protein
VLVVILSSISLQIINLNDDAKVLEKIRNDPRITYHYIKLEKIETMAGISDTLQHDHGFSFTLLVRQFTAFRDPPDTTPLKDNSRVMGYVDMNLKVWYIGEFQGDGVIL